ncbi:MAG: hypothetical protein KGL39_42395 [Patescibacteria group bacterium]|nr:hypothetical protein [Patescibacteria group bacterium]
MSIRELAKLACVSQTTLRHRLVDQAMPVEVALTAPLNRGHKGQVTKRNRMVTAFGKTMPLRWWSDNYNVNYGTLLTRLDAGWTPEDAITLPAAGSGSALRKLASKVATTTRWTADPIKRESARQALNKKRSQLSAEQLQR